MAGGRPLPGYARSASAASNASIYRFGSPSPQPTTPHMPAGEGDYPFTFNVPVPTTMEVDGMASPTPRQQDGINDATNAAAQAGPNRPGRRQELLYGAMSIGSRGSFHYTPTDRMNNWLAAQNPSGSSATTTSQAFVTAQSHLSTVMETEPAEQPPAYEAVKNLAGTKRSIVRIPNQLCIAQMDHGELT